MSIDTTQTGQFFAAPPMAEPVLPWRPEYGSIEDPGETVHVGGDVYVYSSPDYSLDVNTVFAITGDGVVVVDSHLLPRHAAAVVREIHQRTDQPIRYVTNSHHHPDHVFGNLVFREQGAEIVSSYFTARMVDASAFWYLMFLSGVWGEHLPRTYAVRSTRSCGPGNSGWAGPSCSCSSSPTAPPSPANRSTSRWRGSRTPGCSTSPT
jgi:glyoxylase-like metal-dependent hydrolase (beta-lactamase superfamily II)